MTSKNRWNYSHDILRECIWLIKAAEPEGRYVTWFLLAEYLGNVCSSTTLAQFAAGGQPEYRLSDELVAQLYEAVMEFMGENQIKMR